MVGDRSLDTHACYSTALNLCSCAIDNDIPTIDQSFGFSSAVQEAQRAINAAHVEATCAPNGIGLVKLMGRDSGFIAMHATLASRDVTCCLGKAFAMIEESQCIR